MEKVKELAEKYYDLFLPKIRKMKKSEAMDVLILNGERALENVKNVILTPGWSTNDYNIMVRWITIFDSVKKVVEEVHGDFLELKASYPDKYDEFMKINNKIAKHLESAKGLSTEAGDLREAQKLESKIDFLKSQTGMDEADLKKVASLDWMGLTPEERKKLRKFATGEKSYYLNQIFGSVDGRTFATVVRTGLTVEATSQDKNNTMMVGGVLAAGAAAYFMLRG